MSEEFLPQPPQPKASTPSKPAATNPANDIVGLAAQDAVITEINKGLQRLGLGPLPQNLVVIAGLIGDSYPHSNYKRLYLSLQMNDCIEFRNEDVVFILDIGKGESLRGVIVWFRSDAALHRIRAESLQVQRSFLQGSITGANVPLQYPPGNPWGPLGGGGTFAPPCTGGGTFVYPCTGGGTFAPPCTGGGTFVYPCTAGGAVG